MAFQSSARRKTGAPRDTSPLSVVSVARDSRPDDLPIDEPQIPVKDLASTATSIAQSLLWTANIREDNALKRILVVEPRTRGLGMALRAAGFHGETTALLHMRQPRDVGIAQSYDQIITQDWLPPTNASVSQEWQEGAPQAQERLGVYDALIVNDLTRTLRSAQLAGALAWLSTCLNPLGYLVLAEPAHMVNGIQLARDLLEYGLELVTDPEYIAEDWPRSLMIWQRRSPSEARRSGVAQRIGWTQLAQDRPLQRQLISAYQRIFGGDEWSEWVKCVAPGCGRHYSYGQAQALQPPDRCVCGSDEPLAPFHPAVDVLARLYQDLTPAETSCAYIRFGDVDAAGQERAVSGFAWGYLTDPYRLSRTLLPVAPDDRASDSRVNLLHKLTALLHRISMRDNPAVIYYHADSGVVENTRSLSLTRYLFERSLRFAREQGADVVILRTSLRSPAFRLLTGLGMRPLYWYAGEPSAERWQAARTAPASASHEAAGTANGPSVVDERVVLWGETSALLGIFSTHSDFRLAGRIARGLRAARDESGQA
jgi:hypothetical protein